MTWELPPVEVFLLLNLRWCGLIFVISAPRKNDLVSSQTQLWITASEFGSDINAFFENVRLLCFLSE